MRVFHVQLRPQADPATPGFDRTADDTVLLQIAMGQHQNYQLVHAADVRCKDLHLAYMLTNSIDTPWHSARHPLVTPSGKSRRSTCVNDFMVHGKTVKVVRPIGFARLAINADALSIAQDNITHTPA